MDHKGTIRIETQRLLLRPFSMEDAAFAFRNWMGDEKVTEFLRWEPHRNIEETKDTLLRWTALYKDPAFYQWAIELKEIHEPIGTISVVDQERMTEKVHIGYCIGRKWWHQGITSEAFSAVIPFLFKEVNANRIESQHDPNNPYSGEVMKKCGLKYEGTLRKADWSNKGIVDACMYSLLRDEWFCYNHTLS